MNIPKKVIKSGNTTVFIHSKLACMDEAEQKEWFEKEWKRGNSVLKEIAYAVNRCYEVR